MPVTAYADQKCYGDIIVFHKYDDQMISLFCTAV